MSLIEITKPHPKSKRGFGALKIEDGNLIIGGGIPIKAYDEVRVTQMTRWGVLQELRRYAHPTWYLDLLEWKTTALKALLIYYQLERKANEYE